MRSVIPTAVGLAAILVTATGHGGQASEDHGSLEAILGVKGDTADQREHYGRGIGRFRLYTDVESTAIVWQLERDHYVYMLEGERHVARAAALFGLLAEHGLERYTAEREYFKADKFSKYYRVVALQIGAQVGSD